MTWGKITVLVAILVGSAAAQTTITDTIRVAPENSTFSGRVSITAPGMYYNSTTYAPWTREYTVTAGALSVVLIPNDAATPANTSYKVTYYPSTGAPAWTETWYVTTSATPLKIADVTVRQLSTLNIPRLALSQLGNVGTSGQVIISDGSKWKAGTVAALGVNSDQIGEGNTNLYFTAARVRAALSAASPLSYNSSTGQFTCPTCGSGSVSSVFGRLGAVTAQNGDYTFSQIGGTAGLAQGGTNQTSWTAGRCVQVSSDGTKLEVAAAACGTGSGGAGAGGETSFTSQSSVTITHGYGTTAVLVQCRDAGSPSARIEPSRVVLTDSNNVTVEFSAPQSGSCVVAAPGALVSGYPPVSSVFGRTGAVTASGTDYSSFYAALSHVHLISGITGLQTALDAKAPLTGSGASGTWGINVTGSAGTVIGIDWSAAAANGFVSEKSNITTRTNSGFYNVQAATTANGWPETTNNWYHLITSTHHNADNYFSLQLAADFFTQKLWYRSTNNNGSQSWSKIWTSSNMGTGSGLDADVLRGAYPDTGATANTIAARNSNGELEGQSVHAKAAGVGYVTMEKGSATNTGSIAFYKANGTRLGHIGYSPTNLDIVPENGAIVYVGGDVNISGGLTAQSGYGFTDGTSLTSAATNITHYAYDQTSGAGVSGDLSAAGAGKTLTFTRCPLGVYGTSTTGYVWIEGGTGTAEAAPITGGTCSPGSSGTLVVTTANTHTGAWHARSASAGIFEMLKATGKAYIPPGQYTVYAQINVPCYATIYGDGPQSDIRPNTESMTVFRFNNVSDATCSGFSNVTYRDFALNTGGNSAVNSNKGIHITQSYYDRIEGLYFGNIADALVLDRANEAVVSRIKLVQHSKIFVGSTNAQSAGANFTWNAKLSDIMHYRYALLDSSWINVPIVTLQRCVTCTLSHFTARALDYVADGVHILNGSEAVALHDVVLVQPRRGIYMAETTVDTVTAYPMWTRIHDFHVDQYRDCGIVADKVQYTSIIAPVITNGHATYAAAGIYVGVASAHTTISNGMFTGMSRGHAIQFAPNTSNMLISGNTFAMNSDGSSYDVDISGTSARYKFFGNRRGDDDTTLGFRVPEN